jgi:hypothetical protein
LAHLGNYSLRNQATLGGNLVQGNGRATSYQSSWSWVPRSNCAPTAVPVGQISGTGSIRKIPYPVLGKSSPVSGSQPFPGITLFTKNWANSKIHPASGAASPSTLSSRKPSSTKSTWPSSPRRQALSVTGIGKPSSLGRGSPFPDGIAPTPSISSKRTFRTPRAFPNPSGSDSTPFSPTFWANWPVPASFRINPNQIPADPQRNP